MVEVGAAIGVAKTVAETAEGVTGWYREARSAARTREASEAALLIYNAALLAITISALDAEFRTLAREIDKLESSWPEDQRFALADKVAALADKEGNVEALERSTRFLRDSAANPTWRARVLRLGRSDDRLNGAIDELVSLGTDVLGYVGAREKGPTPAGIEDVEREIRAADSASGVETAKAWARDALNSVDRLTVRSAHGAFGGIAAIIAKKHALPAPDWASLF